jgi:sterol desaturase/sphingolipid hydroxylase (fatty acid hydroxylase superfamily)
VTITIRYAASGLVPDRRRIRNADARYQRGQPVASRRQFLVRMFIAIGIWIVLTLVGLAIGIAGYAAFEGMSFVDAYVNAAMILSGMGPMGELKTTAGKIFAGSYAILSGLIIIIATGFVLAPIFHRILHRFHVEPREE